MPRFIILAVVLAIAFTLYSLVDASMTDARRARGVPKPMWVVICVLLPVIGGILWLTVGKGDGKVAPTPTRPDDDPRFGPMSTDKVDRRIADLEEQLRALDDEVFPGEAEQPGASVQPSDREAGTDKPAHTNDTDGRDSSAAEGSEEADGAVEAEGPTSPDTRDDGTER